MPGISILFYSYRFLIYLFEFYFVACQCFIIEMTGPHQSPVQIPRAPALQRIDDNGMLPWLGV